MTLLSLAISLCFGQTATVKIERQFYDNSYLNFDSIVFEFNGTRFCANDTIPKTINLNKDFDNCTVIIGSDTLVFLTKFKENQEYTIRPGCCCAAFTLEAEHTPRRGTISYKNDTDRSINLSVCEHESDIIEPSERKSFYASESAMCLFKPCQIIVAEADFTDLPYDSELYLKSILSVQWFHFLHGEKIEIVYNDVQRKISVVLVGYLTDVEYEHIWE